MATTTISGVNYTSSPLSNELKVDMRDKIAMLDPDTSQFTTMLMHPDVEKERANSFKVEWMTDQLLPRVTALAATAASADTFLTVTTNEGNYLRSGDIIRNTLTGEAYRVTTPQASGTSVVRAVGSVAAATSTSGSTAKLVVVGHATQQGATMPTRLITQRVADYNYTQIHRDSYGFAETALATQWYGGSLQTKERKKKAIEHKWGIENTLFFGARSYSASSGPIHTSGGLIEYISTNITSASTLDKATLQDFLRTGLQYGNRNMKVLFAAPLVVQVLGELMQDNWTQSRPDDNVWGVKVDYVIPSAWGSRIPVVVKSDWMRNGEGTAGQYGSIAFLVDMGNVQYAPLRDTKLKMNIQPPDADEQSEEYITECSLKVELEQTHSLLKNVNG